MLFASVSVWRLRRDSMNLSTKKQQAPTFIQLGDELGNLIREGLVFTNEVFVRSASSWVPDKDDEGVFVETGGEEFDQLLKNLTKHER